MTGPQEDDKAVNDADYGDDEWTDDFTPEEEL